jgi:hypothetical protein
VWAAGCTSRSAAFRSVAEWSRRRGGYALARWGIFPIYKKKGRRGPRRRDPGCQPDADEEAQDSKDLPRAARDDALFVDGLTETSDYCAAARIGMCAFKKRRTRSIVRCLSSSGSFHG